MAIFNSYVSSPEGIQCWVFQTLYTFQQAGPQFLEFNWVIISWQAAAQILGRQIMKSMLEYVEICWNMLKCLMNFKNEKENAFHAINAFKMPPVVWHPGPSWLRSAKIRRWMVEADTVLSNEGIHPLCLGFFSQLGLLWRFLNFGSLWPSFCCSTWIIKYKTYQNLPLSDSRASRWLALDQVTHLTCACSADWNVLKQ